MPSTGPDGANLGTIAARSPSGDAKGYIRNLILYEDDSSDYPDTVRFWFRPTEVQETVNAVYEKMRVMGMSHQYASYSHTDNFTFTFPIYFNAIMIMKEISTQGGIRGTEEGSKSDLALIAKMIEEDRRFIEALLLPYEGPGGVIGVSPPPVIVCIPGILTLRMRVMNVGLAFTDCDIEGNIKELSLNITVEEAPMARVTMRDHLAAGNFRTWGI